MKIGSIRSLFTIRSLVIGFILAGATLLFLRHMNLGGEYISSGDSVWKIVLSGEFEVHKGNTIGIPQPKTGRYYKPISQRFFHPGFKVQSSKHISPGFVRATAAEEGIGTIVSEYHVQLSTTPATQISLKAKLSPVLREKYLKQDTAVELVLPLLEKINESIVGDTENKKQVLHNIYRYAQKIPFSAKNKYSHLVDILNQKKANNLGRASLMISLCRYNGIPARLISGFILEENPQASPYYWVQVYDEQSHWRDYDPQAGYENTVPGNYVAFSYDNPTLFLLKKARIRAANYSISLDPEMLAQTSDLSTQGVIDIFDLSRLDIDTKDAIMHLLVLPFCVLLTAFLRSIVGLYPFGTFTSPLLGLAMVYAEIPVTLTVATLVLLIALFGRRLLPDTLSRPIRLTIIYTFVAMSMVLSVSILNFASFDTGRNIIVLPTIILTALVDRLYHYLELKGSRAAIVRLAVTSLIAFLCIPILTNEELRNFTLHYPEIHFFTIALVLMFATYKGKKLTDFPHLRLLGENRSRKQSSKSAQESEHELD